MGTSLVFASDLLCDLRPALYCLDLPNGEALLRSHLSVMKSGSPGPWRQGPTLAGVEQPPLRGYLLESSDFS